MRVRSPRPACPRRYLPAPPPGFSPDRPARMTPQPLPADPEVTVALAREHGLTDDEYARVQEVLGRVPTYTELGVYSVMWSEHCSYKNSIALLKTLPRDGERLLAAAGDENAGLVDIGGGLAVAFKIESHNHPSAVEPYQGAATGVGGIQRDIFTMGARPIASLNSLRFGSLESPRVRFLFDGVVRGIGGYGNSFGVPTVGGEVVFDASYEGNPLVNAMSVGVVKVGETVSATAEGVGNPVYIVGSATGRDGIHGATFASEEISEDSDAKRPNVQVGDPFTEKLLLEASLEAIATGAVVGMQDMGAAGITCSSSEMSEKGRVGMDLQLDRTPQREAGMTPYELLLSESQERMLVVVAAGREAEIEAVFDKWDLHAVQIGEVTDTERVRVFWHGDLVVDVPAASLVLGGGAPVYHRETARPGYLDATRAWEPASLPDLTAGGDGAARPAPGRAPGEALVALMGSPNVASKRWVFEQYDHEVRTNTVAGPGPTDAAVVRLKGAAPPAGDGEGGARPAGAVRGLAMTTDCNGRYVYLNPRRGAQIAVAEAARNVVCAGGEPLAVTNCLNFGNPYKPEVYWQFAEAVGGMGDACRALGTPVTGGNVSFYNESPRPRRRHARRLPHAHDRDGRARRGRRRAHDDGRVGGAGRRAPPRDARRLVAHGRRRGQRVPLAPPRHDGRRRPAPRPGRGDGRAGRRAGRHPRGARAERPRLRRRRPGGVPRRERRVLRRGRRGGPRRRRRPAGDGRAPRRRPVRRGPEPRRRVGGARRRRGRARAVRRAGRPGDAHRDGHRRPAPDHGRCRPCPGRSGRRPRAALRDGHPGGDGRDGGGVTRGPRSPLGARRPHDGPSPCPSPCGRGDSVGRGGGRPVHGKR